MGYLPKRWRISSSNKLPSPRKWHPTLLVSWLAAAYRNHKTERAKTAPVLEVSCLSDLRRVTKIYSTPRNSPRVTTEQKRTRKLRRELQQKNNVFTVKRWRECARYRKRRDPSRLC